jgi:cysteinyl-tRNA synthetase
MQIFDTMRRKKVTLIPIKENEVRMYLCGPTVYDYGHLGHGRSAIVFDLLRRYLLSRGYRVDFVRNWTDIDDKTIDRAAQEGISVKELAEKFINIYREDFSKLNILEPDFEPKPTEHIGEIIDLIRQLFDRGHAYLLDDGVYYDICTFDEYGRLSGQPLEELRSGARVEVSEGKRNPGDFVLWKFEKPGEPSWESPWGKGRPGWHIECSAMCIKYLGGEFDLHCGGQDLIFPHHEDEIAQAAGAGYRFARYWMHNGFLNIEGEKMSKSLKNFFTLREIFEKFSPLTVRFFLVSTHYRAPLAFSEETLKQSEAALGRFNDFILRVKEVVETAKQSTEDANVSLLIQKAEKGFEEGLEDDLNVSRSLAALSDLLRDVNILIEKGKLSAMDAEKVLSFMKKVDQVLGVFTFEKEMLPDEIERRIEQRNSARDRKDFQTADRIRNELQELGIVLEDTKEGTRWKRVR